MKMLLLETNTNLTSCRQSPTLRNDKGCKVSTIATTKDERDHQPIVRRTHRRKTSDSTRLRSNLLRKLGIPASAGSSSGSSCSASSTYAWRANVPPKGSLLRFAKVEKIPLKCTDDDDDHEDSEDREDIHDDDTTIGSSSPGCRMGGTSKDAMFHALGSSWLMYPTNSSKASTTAMSPGTTSTTGTGKRVHFSRDVSMVPIPTRHDYSQRIRRYLWDTPTTMQENVVRNTLEYSADHWDVDQALEEDEHYYNPTTGEYIHPIHLEIAQMPLEEQRMLGVTEHYVNPATEC